MQTILSLLFRPGCVNGAVFSSKVGVISFTLVLVTRCDQMDEMRHLFGFVCSLIRCVRVLILSQYELLVDQDAHRPRAPERLRQTSHFGQLQRILALPLKPRTVLNDSEEDQTLLLAFILEAKTVSETTEGYPVTWYEGDLGSGEVVDARTVQCVVGRVKDRKRWWIIDRSSEIAYPLFT
jgi:hypothetical protein